MAAATKMGLIVSKLMNIDAQKRRRRRIYSIANTAIVCRYSCPLFLPVLCNAHITIVKMCGRCANDL